VFIDDAIRVLVFQNESGEVKATVMIEARYRGSYRMVFPEPSDLKARGVNDEKFI